MHISMLGLKHLKQMRENTHKTYEARKHVGHEARKHCKFLILIMRKKPQNRQEFICLSKRLLITIARSWDSRRFSVSQKVFNTSKFWLILSKNFLDLGMVFVYEKMTAYKIVSPRKSIFSMGIFSTLKQLYNKHYIHFFYNHQISSVQLQICLRVSRRINMC